MVARTGSPLPRLRPGHDRTGAQVPDAHARCSGPVDGLRPGACHHQERAGCGSHRLCLRPVPHHLYPAFRAQRRGGTGGPYLGGQVRGSVPDPTRNAALRLALRGEQEVEASRPLHILLLGCDSRTSFRTAGHRAVHARLRGGLAVVTVAVYVPPVATFIGDHLIVPGLLWRLAWPIPLLALISTGWMIWEALSYAEARLRGLGIGLSVTRVLPLALVVLLTAAAAPPSVEKAVGLYRKFEVARTTNYDPDPIYPWFRGHIQDPGVLLARDSANNIVPAYTTSLNVVSQRGEGMIRDRKELEEL